MEDGQEAAPDRSLDFDDTFRRWFGPMVRSLAVAAGDREVAADCVQDAFMRAYVRWNRVSRLDDPVAWIRHVAVNRMRDHFRKLERGGRAMRPACVSQQPMVADAPDGAERARRACCAQLPDRSNASRPRSSTSTT